MVAKNEFISFPLSFVKENEIVYISELRGGNDFKEKCIRLGIVPGHKVEIINASKQGPCILAVNDSRIMLGHGMVNKIFVKTN